MLHSPDILLHNRLIKWSKYLAIVVVANGLLALLGWIFDIGIFKHPLPLTLSMNPVAALALVFSGSSFLLLSSKKKSKPQIVLGYLLALLVFLIGGLKSIELLFDFKTHIDVFLFPEKIKVESDQQLIRMAPTSAISFALMGTCLLLLRTELPGKRKPSHFLALITGFWGLLALIGYMYRVQIPINGKLVLVPFGIHAAMCFLLLSLSILFAEPDKGFMRELTSRLTGSITARMLIPVAIVIPAILGSLRLISHWNELMTAEFGTAILIFIIILTFLAFIWYSTVLLNRRDVEQEKAKSWLKESEQQIQTIFRAAPDAVIVIDQEGRIMNWNPKAEEIFGWAAAEVNGKLLSDTIIPDRFRNAHKEGMKNFLKTGEGPVINKTIEIQAINKDNAAFDISLSIAPTKIKDKYIFIGFIRDITETRKAEENVRYNALLLHNVSDAVISTDEKLTIKSWNDAAQEMYGYTSDEAIGQPIAFLRLQLTKNEIEEKMEKLLRKGSYKEEYNGVHKTGKEIQILASVNVIYSGNTISGYVAVHHDITYQKELERKLIKFNQDLSGEVEEKAAEIKNIFERVSDAFIALDTSWRYTYVNKRAEQIFNRKPGSLIGKNIWAEFPDDSNHAFQKAYEKAMTEQQYVYIEQYYAPYDKWFENHIYPSNEGLSVYLRDVTEKKKAEEKLVQSEKKFRALVENNEGIISLIDENFKVYFRSPAAARITGWTNSEFDQKEGIPNIHPDDIDRLTTIMKNSIEHPGRPLTVSFRVKHKKGYYIYLEGVINNMLHDPSVSGIITNLRDVTEQREAEEKIIKANRLYYFISQVNQMIVRTTDQETLFREACHIAVEFGHFRMAWIGMIDEKTEKVIPVMHAGEDEDYPSTIKSISVAESPVDRGPTGTGLREGRFTVCNDIENDPQMAPWKKIALNRGYRSVMAVPIKKFGKVVGVFSFYTEVKNFFDETEIALLQEATGDVSFALEVFEKEAQRKKADDLLAINEKRFRKLIENGNDAFVILTTERKPIYVSSSVERVLGYTEEEAFNLDLFSITHPDDMEKVKESFAKAIENPGIPVPGFISRILHKDGTWHWFEDTITNLLDDPDVGGIVDNFRDVTEKVKAQKALEESEERYQLIGKAANDAVWEWNLETNEVWGNETHQQLYGLTIADPVPDDEEWKHRLHKEDKERITTSIQEALNSSKTIWDAEYRLNTENKGWINVFGRTYIERNEKGKPIRMLGSMMDITERKEAELQVIRSEQKYRTLIEQASDGIIIYSPNGVILDFNESAYSYMGYTKDEFRKLSVLDFFFKEDLEERPLHLEAFKPGQSIIDYRKLKKKNGTAITMEISTKIMNDGNLMAVARDITERLKAEEKLKQSYQEIRQLASHLQNVREEERLKMSREIHDELGQHLTVMKMDVSWLHKKIEKEDISLREKTEGLKKMLDETVTTVRRISSELRPSVLDDMGLTVAIEWHLREFERRSGVKTVLENLENEPVLEGSTKIGLFRILQESLTNVARYANAEKVTVRFTEKNNELKLSIEDDGVGFDIGKIANKKTLGILGMKERSIMMGGLYEIKSVPDRGTIVTVKVPLATNK